MKRRAFTLAELLAVIAILGIIALIVFPITTSAIKDSKQKLYERQIDLLQEAARKWGLDHLEELPENSSTNAYLTLETLTEGGYISTKDIKDPRTSDSMVGCIVVSYSDQYNQYEYLFQNKTCSSLKPTA